MKKYSVYLRAFRLEDAELINKWRNDEKLLEKTCGRFRYVGIEMEKAWVNNKIMNNSHEEYFAICLNDGSDKMIGYMCIREIDLYNRKANADGIVIDPEYHDGQYMVDANILLLDYVFRHIGVNRLEASCLESHITSRVMMESLGYQLESIERESLYLNHEYKNVCRYALLYSDYKEMLDTDQYSIKQIAKKAIAAKRNLKKHYGN